MFSNVFWVALGSHAAPLRAIVHGLRGRRTGHSQQSCRALRGTVARMFGSGRMRRIIAWPCLLIVSCAGGDECELDAVSRDVGGTGLIDCGIASPTDSSSVDRCALTAYRGNNTFRAIYEREDGGLEAFVHAAGGSYHLLRLAPDGNIERADCDGAVVVQEGARSYVSCEEPSEFEVVCR